MFFSEFIFELEKKVYAKSAFLPALIGAGVLSICAPYCIMMCYLAVLRVRTHTRMSHNLGFGSSVCDHCVCALLY